MSILDLQCGAAAAIQSRRWTYTARTYRGSVGFCDCDSQATKKRHQLSLPRCILTVVAIPGIPQGGDHEQSDDSYPDDA